MEVFEAGKVFEIKELPFNGTVDGFNVAVIAPGPIGNPFVATAESLYGFLEAIPRAVLTIAADEFRAVVGLAFQAGHFNAARFQILDASLEVLYL